jgi:[acyl-carrier-protein] S-malonyltransferase
MAVAGHSLGELTAAYAAGVMDYESLIRLAICRGQAGQQAARRHPGGMLAVAGLAETEVDEIIRQASVRGVIVKANLNLPNQTVISGEEDALLAAGGLIRARRGRAQRLKVSGPWHSPLMADAQRTFGAALRDLPFRDAALPLYSNVSAAPENAAERIKTNLERQICAPVRWLETMRRLLRDYPEAVFVEIGPGRVLKSFLHQLDPRHPVFHVEDLRSLDDFTAGFISF